MIMKRCRLWIFIGGVLALTPVLGGPLHDAAKNNNVNDMNRLISEGTDVNIRDEYQFTPLHSAASEGHVAAATLLVEKGAAVDARDEFGTTPLHLAASKGKDEMVKLLLDKGADINARDGVRSSTALHFAVERGHVSVARGLLSRGADPKMKNKDNKTPLQLGLEGMLEALSEPSSGAAKDEDTEELLRTAIEHGDRNLVEKLLSQGARVNAIWKGGGTALHWAVYRSGIARDNNRLKTGNRLLSYSSATELMCTLKIRTV